MVNNKGNYTKTNFQADIKRKQALWNRFKRRYYASNSPTERQWLKNEANRISTELKQWSKRWQSWGYGGNSWITKNYTPTYFNSFTSATGRKTTYRKSPSRKTYGHRTTSGSTTYRTKAHRTNQTRSSAARKNYVAW
ncbi:MAG: hypothetical protein JXQ75_01995 [Phycisphaerae bacterium]|nr:hypothetical protein [Phycisphaerae bacterium]